jgi:WD40 repeat protein
MEVVVGSYEGYVLGYRVVHKPATSDDAEPKWKLKMDFADKCHSHTVKCLGASTSASAGEGTSSKGTLVASGSVDETVAVFDLTRRKIVGVLQEHSSTVTAVAFFGKRVALTAGEHKLQM